MGLTNFPFGVTSFGAVVSPAGGVQPVGGLGKGKAYWVDPANGSDGNTGFSPSQPLSTLSAAHSKMTANQNDTAYVIGNSSAASGNVVSETATLVWSKNLCHIVGVNSFNRISHRVSIRAVTNDFTPLVSVTADGCVFANFHVFHGFATDSAQIAWAETGQRNSHFNLHIGGMGAQLAADNAGSRSMTLTGDGERYFKDCTFGLDTVDRGAANATVEFISAAVRDVFEDCIFIARVDAATPVHVDADASGAIDRFTYFKNCMFHNFSTTAMTEAMNVHASAGGNIILHDCQVVNATDWEAVASGNVFVEAAQANTTSGIMVAFSV